jgi:hypothetical protein
MRALLLVTATLFVGCGGRLEHPERFTDGGAGACQADTTIFAARCATAGCHSATAPAAGLDLASAGLQARLVDHPSMGCSGAMLIDSKQPDASLLLKKLAPSPPCGYQMPMGGTPLTTDEQRCVSDWVQHSVQAWP